MKKKQNGKSFKKEESKSHRKIFQKFISIDFNNNQNKFIFFQKTSQVRPLKLLINDHRTILIRLLRTIQILIVLSKNSN